MKKRHRVETINKKWIESETAKPGWQRDLYRSNINSFINFKIGRASCRERV